MLEFGRCVRRPLTLGQPRRPDQPLAALIRMHFNLRAR